MTLSGRLGSDVEFILKFIEELCTFFAGCSDLDVKFLKICNFSVFFTQKFKVDLTQCLACLPGL